MIKSKMSKFVLAVFGTVSFSLLASCDFIKSNMTEIQLEEKASVVVTEKDMSPKPENSGEAEVKVESAPVEAAPQTVEVKAAQVAAKTAKPDDLKNRQIQSIKKLSQSGTGEYIIHMGAFQIEKNANNLKSELKGLGLEPTLKSMSHKDHGKLYVVQLRPYSSFDAAKSEAQKLMESAKGPFKEAYITVNKEIIWAHGVKLKNPTRETASE